MARRGGIDRQGPDVFFNATGRDVRSFDIFFRRGVRHQALSVTHTREGHAVVRPLGEDPLPRTPLLIEADERLDKVVRPTRQQVRTLLKQQGRSAVPAVVLATTRGAVQAAAVSLAARSIGADRPHVR